mgnify:CR=1 FL=1
MRDSSKLAPVDAFVAQMNALAKQLKMERTRFVNPHGIDYKVRPVPYSTAEDMARLTRYAMNKASFRFYVSQKERQISFDRARAATQLHASQHERTSRAKWALTASRPARSSAIGAVFDSVRRIASRKSLRQGQQETVYQRHLMMSAPRQHESIRRRRVRFCSAAGSSMINGRLPVVWPIQRNCFKFRQRP